MQIIGMLDWPFVRRVAITMELLGIRYQHPTWRFTQIIMPEEILGKDYPALADYCARAELLPAFIATPPL
jgi:glutathione S-transferase